MPHKKKTLFIILIILTSAALRFYNLMHDAPYFFNPDERNMASSITRFRLPIDIPQLVGCIASELQLPIFNFQNSNCSLNPHFFAYGQFPLYLAFASDQIIKVPINLISQIATDNRSLTTNFPSAIFWLRFWSALFSTFTVLLVYLITKELFGNWKLPRRAGSRFAGEIGNYAAIIAAFTPGLIQSAHFGTTESLLTFFFLSSIYLSLKLLSSPKYLILNTKYIILLSLVIGLSLGSKLTGIFFFVPPFLALMIRIIRVLKERKKERLIGLLGYLVIWLLISSGSILFFIISSPYNLIQPDNFKSAVFGYEADVAMGKYEAFYTRQFVNTAPILFQAEKIFPYALGWPVFILGILGLLFISHNIMLNSYHFILQSIKYHVLRIRYKKRKISKNILNTYYLILITSFLIYFIPNAFLFAKWTRFMTPILPFFAIFAGYLLFQISTLPVIPHLMRDPLKWIPGQTRNDKILSILLLAFLISSIIPGLAFMSIYTHEDTRVTASKWIYQNIPDKSYILSETANVVDIPLGIPSYNLQPTTYNLNVISFDFYHMDENPKLFEELLTHLEKADYILIPSRRIFTNYPKLPQKYPFVTKYYQLLFSGRLGFEKMAEISSYPTISFPSLSLTYNLQPTTYNLSFSDENAEETYTVFDHPVIRIYRKVKQLSKDEYRAKFSILNFQSNLNE